MADLDQSQKVSVWEYVNPVSLVKDSIGTYFNPISAAIYGPWRAMSMGYGLTLPGLIPNPSYGMTGFRHVGAASQTLVSAGWQKFTSPAFRAGKLGKFVGSAGKGLLFGMGAETVDEVGMNVANMGIRGARKNLARTLMKNGMSTPSLAEYITANAGGLGPAKLAITQARGQIGARAIGSAALIRLGRIVNPVMNAIALYQVTAWAAETAFKGIRASVDIIENARERISSLELGGELSRGFMTGQAATERQRALQAIQGSHLAGRRFMGNEAAMVHQ